MTQPRNFGFGEDETILRDSARKFLADNASVEALRRLVARDHKQAYESAVPPAPWDEGLWQQMVELGWSGLAVPERAGGLGMKMVAVAALAEAAGHAALVSPLITSLLATCVLRECDTAAATAALERIGGGTPMALAVTNARGSWAAEDTDVTAKTAADGAVLNGTSFVQDARKVRLRRRSGSDAGVGLYVVDADAPGSRHPDRVIDLAIRRASPSPTCACPPTAPPPATPARPPSARPAGAADDRRRRHAARASGSSRPPPPTPRCVAFDRPLASSRRSRSDRQHDARRRSGALVVYNAACATTANLAPPSASRAGRPAPARWPISTRPSVQLHGGIGSWNATSTLVWRQQHNQLFLGDAAHHRPTSPAF
jgi:hypothetical protein